MLSIFCIWRTCDSAAARWTFSVWSGVERGLQFGSALRDAKLEIEDLPSADALRPPSGRKCRAPSPMTPTVAPTRRHGTRTHISVRVFAVDVGHDLLGMRLPGADHIFLDQVDRLDIRYTGNVAIVGMAADEIGCGVVGPAPRWVRLIRM